MIASHQVAIRHAVPDDLLAMLDIYNEVVAHSTAIYALTPSSLAERKAWFDSRIAAGFPVLVATASTQVLGFASFGEFRGAWPGYRYSVEHSVHVHKDHRGQGVGSQLLRALFPLAAAQNKHVMVGGIDASNDASLRMHERLGFVQVAHFREVGHKFGRWLDLVFVQRFIDEAGAARADDTPDLERMAGMVTVPPNGAPRDLLDFDPASIARP
jgi:L-amino acid N-acyltransferase